MSDTLQLSDLEILSVKTEAEIQNSETLSKGLIYDANGNVIAKENSFTYNPNQTYPRTITPIQDDLGYWKQAIPFSDLVKMEFTEPEWAVRRIVPKNSITAISGAPSLYKSFILAVIGIACASGEKVFGEFETEQMAVMIVDEENHKRRISTRLKQLTDKLDLPIYYHIVDGFRVTDPDMMTALMQEAKSKNIKLLMFDTLVRIHNLDENKASDINLVYQELQKFTQAGITVVFTHHHKKQGLFKTKTSDITGFAEAMRGSSDILGMIDAHLGIQGLKQDENEKYLVALQTKQRDEELLPAFKIKIISDDLNLRFEYSGEYDESAGVVNEAMNRIVEIMTSDNSGYPLSQLVQMLEKVAKSASIRNALKELKKKDQILSKTRALLKKEGIDKGSGNGNELFYFLK